MTREDIALNRFGLGARPGERDRIGVAEDWLIAQTRAPAGPVSEFTDLPTGAEAFQFIYENRRRRRQMRDASDAAVQNLNRSVTAPYITEVTARTALGARTDDGFRERLVQFWSNHFTVSAGGKRFLLPAVGSFEREAIRPHVFGRFEDMLRASALHQVMLAYLDNVQSVGPNSRAGERRDVGLNENLARETLELHTLGVDGGYTQTDVTSFAKILTGWSVDRESGEVVFRNAAHEPGAHVLLGKRYGAGGAAQAEAALRDLARHPATARNVARKLAAHMLSDTPPQALVDELERVFRTTGGDLGAVARALVTSRDMWGPEREKFKTPNEFIISTLRAFNAGTDLPKRLLSSFDLLAQRPFTAPSPAGWPDEAEAWAGPNAVKQRLEWSLEIGARVDGRTGNPALFAETVLGPDLSEETKFHLSGAESAAQGVGLFLMSPEFQRR